MLGIAKWIRAWNPPKVVSRPKIRPLGTIRETPPEHARLSLELVHVPMRCQNSLITTV